MHERTAIALICDNNYIMPASVVIASIIKNKLLGTLLDIFIVSADLSDESIYMFSLFESDTVRIIIKKESTEGFQSLHNFTDGIQKTRITTAALLKFKLPEIVVEYDKLLYLDCDVIVCEDLSQLYNQGIEDYFCAAVLNTTRLYLNNNSHHMHTYMLIYKDYFNSGVMLLNLKKMRSEKSAEKLLLAKMEMTDAYFMDQDQLNAVFNGYVKLLPIRYNAQYVNLVRASARFDISALNEMYETNYTSLQDVANDAVIIHFASADKPWLSMSTPLASEWYEYFLFAKTVCPSISKTDEISYKQQAESTQPKVSVIIPHYNEEKYVSYSIDSIIHQTLKDIQIICVDDGSTDSTLDIVKNYATNDERFIVLSQRNKGPSSARNSGIAEATGEFIYFLDSDALLSKSALKLLYDHAKATKSQNVLFDGEVIFENDDLKERFSHVDSQYKKSNDYPQTYKGDELYPLMVKNNDFSPLLGLQFFERKFVNENKLRFNTNVFSGSDNLFTLQAQLLCHKISYLRSNFYCHMIREKSILTEPFSQKKMIGYYTSVIEILGFLADNHRRLSDSAIVATKQNLRNLQTCINKKFKTLPKRQRIQPMFLNPYLNVVSNVVFTPLITCPTKKNKRRSFIKKLFVSIVFGVWFTIRPIVRKSKFLISLVEKFHNHFID